MRCWSALALYSALISVHLLVSVGLGFRFIRPSSAQLPAPDALRSVQGDTGDMTTSRRLLQYEKVAPVPYKGWVSTGCSAGHIPNLELVYKTENCLKVLDLSQRKPQGFSCRGDMRYPTRPGRISVIWTDSGITPICPLLGT